jgi:hypothetical protein
LICHVLYRTWHPCHRVYSNTKYLSPEHSIFHFNIRCEKPKKFMISKPIIFLYTNY